MDDLVEGAIYRSREDGAEVRLHLVRAGVIHYRPGGGAIVVSEKSESFSDRFEATDAVPRRPATLKPVLVDADWIDDDFGPLPGYAVEDSAHAFWNGHVVPLFERRVVDEAVQDGRMAPFPDGEERVLWCGSIDSYVRATTGGQTPLPAGLNAERVSRAVGAGKRKIDVEGVEIFLSEDAGARFSMADGSEESLYDIGGRSWCWLAVEMPEHAEAPRP